MKTKAKTSLSCFVWIGLFALVARVALATPALIDVDFTSVTTTKVGFAAVGVATNDFWNTYAAVVGGVFQRSGATPNLAYVNGTDSGAGLTVSNASGGNSNGSTDPMYQAYLYTYGGNITFTVTNLSAGMYDFYLYGHGNQDDQNSVFQLSVGGVSQGTEATTTNADWISPAWQQGVQYVEFTNVSVGAGQTVAISVEPGASSYACLFRPANRARRRAGQWRAARDSIARKPVGRIWNSGFIQRAGWRRSLHNPVVFYKFPGDQFGGGRNQFSLGVHGQ